MDVIPGRALGERRTEAQVYVAAQERVTSTFESTGGIL
jgi:hypothetical protein